MSQRSPQVEFLSLPVLTYALTDELISSRCVSQCTRASFIHADLANGVGIFYCYPFFYPLRMGEFFASGADFILEKLTEAIVRNIYIASCETDDVGPILQPVVSRL